MSTDVILEWWGKYWSLAVKILGIAILFGATMASKPSRTDVREMIRSADNPYVEERAKIPNRESILEWIAGPANPYTADQPLIMRVVSRYDRDQELIMRGLMDIQVKVGLLLAQQDRDEKRRR